MSVSLLYDRYRCLAQHLTEATFGNCSSSEAITVCAPWTCEALESVPRLAPKDSEKRATDVLASTLLPQAQ
jgi:hypothetical protein